MSTSEVALGQGLPSAGASGLPGVVAPGLPGASAPSGDLGALSQAGHIGPGHVGPSPVGQAAVPGPEAFEGHALGRMIEQLANEYFTGVPGPALNLGRSDMPALPVAPAGLPAPGPVSPPSGVFPAATSLGGAGISPGSGWVPPAPGFMQQPPPASGPFPKESDLRTLPAMLSEGLGISSPVALAQGFDAKPDAMPYFLEIAGLPKGPEAGPGASPGSFAGGLPLAGMTPAGPGAAPSVFGAEGVPGHAAYPEHAAATEQAPSQSGSQGTIAPSGLVTSVPLVGSGVPDGVVPAAGASSGNFGVPPALQSSAPTRASSGAVPGFGSGANPGHVGTAPNGGAANGAGHASPAQPSGAVGQGSPQPVPAQGGARGADTRSLQGSAPSTASGYSYDAHELSLPSSAYDARDRSAVAPESLDRSVRKPFNPASLRNDFPILKERIHNHDLVWFDNAATTQKPQVVIDRIKYFYEHESSNIHRAAHTLAARSTDAYEGARETVRRFINAPSVGEIIFVRGTTEGINLVSQTWGRRYLQSGDEVVITWLEHHANIVPWQLICSERGARLKVAPVDDNGQVIPYEYEKLLGPRTKFVSMSQVSNALGTIVPVQEMISMAHRYGAKVLVDGAQAVSHMAVDVQALDADFYVFSGHKIFGPTGIGAVFGKAAVLEGLPPWQGGGNMIKDVTFEKTQFQGPPARFEAGTPNIADAVGLGAALDYVSSIGIDNISRYEHELLVYATERLVRIPGLRLYGTAPEKAGVLSFTIDGLRTEDIGVALDQEGIAVRAGHHCAQPILRRFGVEQTVRASLAPYNDTNDVDRLVSALQRLRAVRY